MEKYDDNQINDGNATTAGIVGDSAYISALVKKSREITDRIGKSALEFGIRITNFENTIQKQKLALNEADKTLAEIQERLQEASKYFVN
jgi:hypothetical protein